MSTSHSALSAQQKLAFLQQIRQHLMLSPEEYRLLIINVLNEHRSVQAARLENPLALAA